jgi:hypothetical protein
MTPAPANPNQALVVLWIGQMIGTLVIAAVVVAFVGSTGAPFKDVDASWSEYALGAALVAIAPALLYLPGYKARLDQDAQLVRRTGGQPDPAMRKSLTTSLTVGSALCELPQAFGLVHLLLGGQTRWFLAATLVTIALRVSYRPFVELSR